MSWSYQFWNSTQSLSLTHTYFLQPSGFHPNFSSKSEYSIESLSNFQFTNLISLSPCLSLVEFFCSRELAHVLPKAQDLVCSSVCGVRDIWVCVWIYGLGFVNLGQEVCSINLALFSSKISFENSELSIKVHVLYSMVVKTVVMRLSITLKSNFKKLLLFFIFFFLYFYSFHS